jgi:hypothetical protein
LLQILVICTTNYGLITQLISTIAAAARSLGGAAGNTIIMIIPPILYYASQYAVVKKFGKAMISLRLIVYELIFGSQMQGTITVGSYILYKYLDDKYGAELAQASQGARDTINDALLAKKQQIEAQFKSMIGEAGNTLAPALEALAFFYRSHDEFIMLLGSNIIETANEVGEDINHAKEIYNYYVAIGSAREPTAEHAGIQRKRSHSDSEEDEDALFQAGVEVVNETIRQQ